jgi:hypothetical protein
MSHTMKTVERTSRTRFAAVGAIAFLGAALLPALAAAQPTITALNPNTVVARQQFNQPPNFPFTVTVSGTDFSQGNTTVLFNGSPRATTVFNANFLQFVLSWEDLATTGVFPVVVRTVAPAPVTGDSAPSNLTVTDPVAPTVTFTAPSSAVAGGAQFTMTVTGTGFVRDTVLRWNGQDRQTSVFSSTGAQMQVLASDIASAAGNPGRISAFTPSPGGGTSADVNFTINAAPAPATPTITLGGLSPSAAQVNGPSFTLTVSGTGFTPTSVVKWEGAVRPTTYVNANALQALIPASDLAVLAGPVNVTVETPGAVTSSNAETFTLTAIADPTLSSLTSPVYARTGPLSISVSGSNFTLNSIVRWNGADRQTTYFNTNFLQAAIPLSDVASTGTATVTVFTPSAATPTSNGLQVAIVNPPAPEISSFSPTTLQQNVTNQLFVTGQYFTTDSVVRINGVDRPTSFSSGTALLVRLSPIDVATLGNLQVSVFTPTPGGGTSAAEPIAVVPASPRPTLSRISPNNVPVGAPAFQMVLTSDAGNFRADSVVRVGGADRPTTYVNSSQLRAQIPASDLAAAGSKAVSVFTPSGNAESDPVLLTVGNALSPIITRLQCDGLGTCAQITARTGNLALSTIGRNFTSQSMVMVNGSARPTTFNSETQLSATLAQADIAASGTLAVKVMTPSAPVESNIINVPIVDPGIPSLTQLSPTSVPAGASATQLRVLGAGFVRDSVVEWNGAALPTSFLGSGELRVTLPEIELRNAGTALVRVNTPAPGGGVSGNVTFAILAPQTPTITTLDPAQVIAGGAAFELVVTGANYIGTSVINWNGSARPTRLGGSSLIAQIPAADIATAGSASITVVTTAAPATSNAMTLPILAAGTPTITLLQPESIPARTPGTTVTVLGSNFTAFSSGRWNGSDRQTTYTSPTQLQMYVLPGDLATAGTGTITVANGSLVSGGAALPIDNPTVPQITLLTPASTIAGSNGVELRVDGPAANLPGAFAPTSVINWNGTALPTTYVNATQLRTFLPLSQLATAGAAQVTVTTPAPGGGTSAPATFLINNPTGPAITSLGPPSATAGSPEFLLAVNGQNFVAGRSIVNWNGTALPTSWNSGTQLSALIPAAEVATAGSAQVTVVTSGPGGGTSISVPFEIVPPRAPDISSLSPSVATAGATAFTLNVSGNNFTPQSVINWNGTALSTIYQGSTLQTVIPAAGVAVAGVATVTVVTPGAPASDSVLFVIANTNGPAIARLNPTRVYAGGFRSSVEVGGAFDCPGIQGALVNGALRQATNCSSSQITVPLLRSDIAAAGSVNIAIQTTTQAGIQTSIALPLAVVNPPAPVVSSVSPSVFRDRLAAQSVSVSGSNFVRGTVLHWNGAPRNTTVSNEGSLSAQITSADLAAAGTATITVVTPAPGGGTSNALVVQIEDPRVPTITSVSPAPVTAVRSGDSSVSISVSGSGYAPNSTVSWNGTPLLTSFASVSSLTALLPGALIRAAGSGVVTVNTPAPGGGTSAAFVVGVVEGTSAIRVTDISPDSVPRGAGSITITVFGDKFLPTSVVEMAVPNFTPLATTFVSANELRAVVPSRFLRDRGFYSIRVDGSVARSWRVHDAYYFGEGVTGPLFDTEYALTNTFSSSVVNVTVTFAKENGTTVQRRYSIQPQRTLRVLVDAIAGMEATSFSTLVETRDSTSAGLIVQRDVRWGTPQYGRHSVAGLRTATDWYFGEGVDASNFDTYLLLGNFGSAAATATITAVRPSGGPLTTSVSVPANSRVTLNLGKQIAGLENRPFGFSVTSTEPIVAERAVYGTGPRVFEFGSVSGGAERPSNLWVLPEGAAGATFDSYHTLANFGTTPVDVRVTILADTGASFVRTLTVPAQARETFAADADAELRDLGGFAAKIEALNGEIVAELAQYAVGAGGYYEAHGGPGLVPTSIDGLGFGTFLNFGSGIGYFGGATNDETYILVANPNLSATTVRVSCVTESGVPAGFTDTAIGPNARATIRAADACTGLLTSPGAFYYSVTTLDGLGIVAGTTSFTTPAGEPLFSAGTFTTGVR